MAPHGSRRGCSRAGGSQLTALTAVRDDRAHSVHQRVDQARALSVCDYASDRTALDDKIFLH